MRNFSDWMDRRIQSVSEWLWRWLAPSSPVVAVGNVLAGVPNLVHLPLERRGRGRGGGSGQAGGPPAKPDSAARAASPRDATANCSSPQYCFIHGHPCACCGGSDTSCPPGTSRGQYWGYCCHGRTIWFVDCCGGTTTCPASCPFCTNSSQPNWCGSAGGSVYKCTLAEDHGACGY